MKQGDGSAATGRRNGGGAQGDGARASLGAAGSQVVPLLLLSGTGGKRVGVPPGSMKLKRRGGTQPAMGKGDDADPNEALLGHHSRQALNKWSGRGSRSRPKRNERKETADRPPVMCLFL